MFEMYMATLFLVFGARALVLIYIFGFAWATELRVHSRLIIPCLFTFDL